MIDKIDLSGLIFRGLTKEKIFNSNSKLVHIVTVNAEYIVKAQKDDKLKKIINNNYSTFDGQIPYWIAKMKNRKVNIEKISGSDFIYDMCQYARINNKSIFLLGGKESSNLKSVELLRNNYNLSIDGYSPEYMDYPFERKHNSTIMQRIEYFKPYILFVGFGAIKQDYWIEDNRDELMSIGVHYVIGSGGTFEFVSGELKRAPYWIQVIGLEGVYRFLQEPRFFRLGRLFTSLKVFRHVFK